MRSMRHAQELKYNVGKDAPGVTDGPRNGAMTGMTFSSLLGYDSLNTR